MKLIVIECLISVLGLLPGSLAAQTKVEISVYAHYRNVAEREPIAPDFAGLSFEITSVMSGANGLAAGVHLFDPQANPHPLALFQQIGIKSLRVGAATGDGCRTPFPSHADLDALFRFAEQANLKIIYQFRMRNPVSCKIPNLEQQSAETAHYLWSHYAQNISALSTGNEDDYHTAHSYCTDGSACTCIAGKGCSYRGVSLEYTHLRPGKTTPALVILDPQMYEVGISEAMANAGSAFPSYLEEWRKYIGAITAMPGLARAPVAGPDAFSYTQEARFTGNVCGSRFTSAAWPELLAACEKNDPKINFLASYGHYYVGGNVASGEYKLTAAEGIANMLSPAWLEGDGISAEPAQPSGIPQDQQLIYTPYSWLYKNNYEPIRRMGMKYRLTESNDYLIGVPGASNSFASALWALDYMHWWAEHGASGVNFHNNQWIYTDTLVPRNNVWKQPGSCTQGPCADYYITPKGYGIKAFNLGGHGYTLRVSTLETNMPDSGSLDAYAIGSGQDLYVTLINKTGAIDSSDTAKVSIKLPSSAAPFVAASVRSITLWNGDLSAPSDPSQITASLGDASIMNTGAQWTGYWTAQPAMTGGSENISVPPAQAMIVHFHAPSNYVGPVEINQNGALEMALADSKGDLYHLWQKSAHLNTESNSIVPNWSKAAEGFSGNRKAGSPAGDIAVANNLDNTLQIFIPTTEDVYTVRQMTPGGAWTAWTDMGSSSSGISHLKAGRNADGSLAVFGLDSSGHLWCATENAPGVAWSNWTELGGKSIKAGYVVGENLNGRLEVFGENGGNVYHIWQTPSNEWSSWRQIAANPGQSLNASLQVARDVSGDLWLFVLDSGGNVWSNHQLTPSGEWQRSWSELPAPSSAIQAGFVAGQNANGRFDIFGVGADSNVYHTWITNRGAWTATWTGIASGAPSGGFDPHLMVSNTNDGRLQVFAVGKNSPNDIFTNWQVSISGPWASWADFGNNTSGLIFSPEQP